MRCGAARRDPKAMAEEEWRRIVAGRMLKQSAACSRPTGHVGFVVSVQLPVCVGSSDRNWKWCDSCGIRTRSSVVDS
jgi:hypothetical protein